MNKKIFARGTFQMNLQEDLVAGEIQGRKIEGLIKGAWFRKIKMTILLIAVSYFSGFSQGIPIALGTLLPGDTLCIIYDAKINDNIASEMVSVQGKVTADGPITVLSDDPETGASNDATKTSVCLPLDFGDAPDPLVAMPGKYPTLLANDGARHVVQGGLYLGASIDSEGDGQPNALGTGDDMDVNGDDEDGVTFTSSIVLGTMSNVDVTATAPGLLDAWMDFNQDGDWGDAGEQIFTSQALAAGVNSLSFSVPGGATQGNTFARFRLSTAGGLLPTGLAGDGEVEDCQVNIIANSFSINDPMVSESGTNMIFIISRTLNTNTDSVDFVITGTGTATTVSDFTNITSGGDSTLAFPAGGTNMILIAVPITEDMLVEADETIIITLNDAKGAGISKSTGTGTINDNDNAIFTINDTLVDESGGNLIFTISLDKQVDIAVSVDVKFTDISATGSGADYTSTDLIANFGANDNANKTVSVPINADNITELSETFIAALSSTSVLGTRTVDLSDDGIGTIVNDDTTKVNISDVIMNESDAGMVNFDFKVTIDKAVDVGLMIDANTCDSTATTADLDYVANTGSSLNFLGSSGEMKTFTVNVNGDINYESNDTFLVKLTNISALGRSVCFSDSIGLGIITNDDLNLVNLSVSTNTGTEIAGTAITVTATTDEAVQSDQTVGITISGLGITGGDYSLTAVTITIPSGMTTGLVTFTIIDDNLPEGLEIATITMSGPSAGIALGAITTQNINISDNDNSVSVSSYNLLSFGDPCNCNDTLNCLDGGVTYFHDSLVIPAILATTPGLNIRIENATNFFIDIPCNGGILTAPTFSGDNPNTGTQIPEVSPGVYKLEFWKPEGLQPTIVIDAYNGNNKVINDQMVPDVIFQPLCSTIACQHNPIPTLGQWGLIILSLLLLTLGVVAIANKLKYVI